MRIPDRVDGNAGCSTVKWPFWNGHFGFAMAERMIPYRLQDAGCLQCDKASGFKNALGSGYECRHIPASF